MRVLPDNEGLMVMTRDGSFRARMGEWLIKRLDHPVYKLTDAEFHKLEI